MGRLLECKDRLVGQDGEIVQALDCRDLRTRSHCDHEPLGAEYATGHLDGVWVKEMGASLDEVDALGPKLVGRFVLRDLLHHLPHVA